MDTEVWIKWENRTIQIDKNGRNVYEIDLDECRNSAKLLDRIYQVRGKRFANPYVMWNLLSAFDEVCDAYFNSSVQVMFCQSGISKDVDFKKAESGSE